MPFPFRGTNKERTEAEKTQGFKASSQALPVKTESSPLPSSPLIPTGNPESPLPPERSDAPPALPNEQLSTVEEPVATGTSLKVATSPADIWAPYRQQIRYKVNFLAKKPQNLLYNIYRTAQAQPIQDTSRSSIEQDEASSPDDGMAQVNNVSQLGDVQPSDWAYEALRSLVERYGCIAGYPDGTFRGNRAMSRYEFAAGLNACLKQIEKLIASGRTNSATKEDLATLQRLTDQFASELAALGTRVDQLEGRTAFLEGHQFSPTAILGAEVIFGLSQAFGGGPPGTGDSNPVFNHLTRLQIVSSFTGKDRLRMELAAGNFNGFGFADPRVLNTNTALLSYQAGTNNSIQLSLLEYRFAGLGDRVVFTFRPVGFSLSSVLTANSPYFDTGRGSISRFGEENPVFKIGALDAGVGMDVLLSSRARLQLAYGARTGYDPSNGFVFGKSAHVAGMQFLLLPGDNLLTGITFVYGYSPDGRLNTFTGSAIADASGFINRPSNIYAVSGSLQWRITPQFTFATWGGVVGTYASSTQAFAVSTNFMFSLGISDLFGRRGDLLAFLIGQPPRLLRVGDYAAANGGLLEDSSSLHIEAFYRYTVNDRISITPGFFVVTRPGNIENNKTIFIGTIRTTFRF